MKRKKTFINFIISALLLFLVMFYFLKPNTVELDLVATFAYSEKVRIPAEIPIWWCFVPDDSQVEYLGAEVVDYLSQRGNSDCFTVISWGLPLAELTYQNISLIEYGSKVPVAKPIFQNIPVSDTIYVYEVTEKQLLDEYLARIEVIPDIKLQMGP